MANNTLLASDNFSSGSLAAGWSPITGLLACKVVGSGGSAVAEPNTVSTNAGQIWTGLTWPSDQCSEVTLGSGWVSSVNPICQLQVRYASNANTGYIVNIVGATGATGTVTIYVDTAGTTTQLAQKTSITVAAGDVWAFQAVGPCLVVYQNYKLVLYWVDTTYTSGSPGFLLFSSTLVDCQVSSWRGYNAVQQQGIWTKQGAAKIPLISTDINTGTSNVNSGIDSTSIILHEGNAQILSGTVYKMWFGTASGIQYAESLDGLTWSRYASTVIAGFSFPQVIKNGSTYYLYCQSNTASPGVGDINVYTSTDGVSWANQSSTVLALGGAGTWDHISIYLFSPVAIITGTWYALYSGTGTNGSGQFAMGLATSSDGITWTKYGSNPVAQNVWASVPYLINGTYYLWPSLVPPGYEASSLNPSCGGRIQSTDLISWTGRIPSIQCSQIYEGVNSVLAFAYPTALLTIGSTTYMYYEGGPANAVSNTGASWNLSVASVPTVLSQVILFPETADSQVATDAFTSGTGDLSANWTVPTGGTKLQIVSGPYCEGTVAGTRCQDVYTGASFGNDQYSQATLHTATGGSSHNLELMVRASTAALTYYMGVISGVTGSLVATGASIYKVVAGSFTQIGPAVPVTSQVGDVFRAEVIGNVISLYQNDFLVCQVEDISNAITSGHPGLQMLCASGKPLADFQVSLWSGGNANTLPAYAASGTGLVMAGGDSADDEEDEGF